MGVSPGRLRIADLTFQVFRRPIHPDWFTTRAFRRTEHREWSADLRIIEGGHCVLFGAGSVRLTEVLAGPEVALPEPGLLFHCHLRRERTAHLRPGGLIEYQSCVDVERTEPEVFRHLCDELALDATRDGLFHRFRSGNRLAPPPLGYLRVDARAGALSIHSFHTFPDECAIVRTQSLFQLKASLTALRPGAIRRIVTVPMVGRRLRGPGRDSRRRRWVRTGRRVDKTSVGPAGPVPVAHLHVPARQAGDLGCSSGYRRRRRPSGRPSETRRPGRRG